MKKFLISMALFLSANFAFATQPEPQPAVENSAGSGMVVTDTWKGKDKRDHFVISGLLGVGSRALLTAQPVTAFGVCLIPGIGKELYDSRRGGPGNWSWKDMLANSAGCGLGVWGTDLVLTKDGSRYTLWLNYSF